MADKKISQLTELTTAANNDLLVIDDVAVSGNNTTKKITAQNFLTNTSVISANLVILNGQQTPANSTITCTEGSIYFDTNYIYVAVANNVLRRVALSAF